MWGVSDVIIFFNMGCLLELMGDVVRRSNFFLDYGFDVGGSLG